MRVIRAPLHNFEQGFTLLEIMIVVVIIGLLAAAVAPTFMGQIDTAAINRAMLRLLDPRDGNVEERLKILDDQTGVWRCHTQFNCVAACPKGINLTDSIMKMKRALLFPKKFHEK